MTRKVRWGVLGTAGIEPTRIFIHDGSDLSGNGREVKEFAICDQFTIQGDLFSRAILENSVQAIPLEDAVKNMAVIDAIFGSASSARWEPVSDRGLKSQAETGHT